MAIFGAVQMAFNRVQHWSYLWIRNGEASKSVVRAARTPGDASVQRKRLSESDPHLSLHRGPCPNLALLPSSDLPVPPLPSLPTHTSSLASLWK